MVPGLLAMTVPLSLLLGPLAVWLGGRARPSTLDERPALVFPPMSARETWLKIALLSAVVYPTLFFAAGWFLAMRSPAVRAFYGGHHGATFIEQLRLLFAERPTVYPLEVARGALWVLAALAVLTTTRGAAWRGTLLVGAWFALLQNDVHLLPNPLMPRAVRVAHFVETASSNFVFALSIGWAMSRSPRRGQGGRPA
jgi:hypothetical protein